MGRGTMPHVGIIKTSKVYTVRSQITKRKMGAPLLPFSVRERKIEAGLDGAFGQAELRFFTTQGTSWSRECVYIYLYMYI